MTAPASIAATAAALAAGTQSARALLADALARIAAEDARWHAMLALDPAAHAAAARADAAAARGESLGPLHGIPLVIKDNIDVAGLATTSGCRALARAMAPGDAPVVARLRAAGAVIVGKANLSELSFEIRSRSSLGGDVRCPLAPHATAGGSSGGSAVAVLRGYALAALGTDTGGSIRVPAACNGLVGFRPAHASLPMAGIAPLAPSTDTVGPITRTVADARLIAQVMGLALPAPADPATPHAFPARLGVLHQAFGDDPTVLAAMDRALARLATQGVALVDVAIPDLEDLLAGPHIVDAEFAVAFDRYLAGHVLAGTAPASLAALVAGGDFLPDHRPALEQRLHAAPEAAPILARHAALRQRLTDTLAAQGLDGLVFPTMRAIPQTLDNPPGGWAPELAARSGWPALSVPAPALPGARPVGVELLVPAGQEALLFALGSLLEA